MLISRFQSLNIRTFSTPPKVQRNARLKPSLLFIVATTTSTILSISYLINSGNKDRKPNELQREYFIPYRITRKIINDSKHFILELTPKTPQKVNIWSRLTTRSLWSIEVKQPEIMIARNYTPLPLKFVNNETNDLTVISSNNEVNDKYDGKLILFIKNYDNGEVSKWLANLPLNHTIEIRGPFIEYTIRNQIDHINFFVAGTGIVSPLQLLLNPYTNSIQRPNLNIFYSSKDLQNELGPLKNVLFNTCNDTKIEDQGYVRLWTFEDSKEQNISEDKNLKNFMKLIPSISKISDNNELSLVCGPESYIETIAGKKIDFFSQGPIEGLLAQKGWSNDNVFKL